MAKTNKNAPKTKTMTEVENLEELVVTVKDLEKEFGLDGKRIRSIIRSLGYRAPTTGLTGMAPQSKYEWKASDARLVKIREAIQNYVDSLDEIEAV